MRSKGRRTRQPKHLFLTLCRLPTPGSNERPPWPFKQDASPLATPFEGRPGLIGLSHAPSCACKRFSVAPTTWVLLLFKLTLQACRVTFLQMYRIVLLHLDDLFDPVRGTPEFLSFLSPFIGRFLGCISSHHRRLHYPWRNWRSTIRVFTLRPSYPHLGRGFHVPLSRLTDIVVAVRALHPGAAASRRITSLPPTGNCSYIPFSPTR